MTFPTQLYSNIIQLFINSPQPRIFRIDTVAGVLPVASSLVTQFHVVIVNPTNHKLLRLCQVPVEILHHELGLEILIEKVVMIQHALHVRDGAFVLQPAQYLATRDFPNENEVVVGTGHQHSAGQAQVETGDALLMTLKDEVPTDVVFGRSRGFPQTELLDFSGMRPHEQIPTRAVENNGGQGLVEYERQEKCAGGEGVQFASAVA